MRVIAGVYRSRPIEAPAGRETRPTSDRLRETLFNVLAPQIPGTRMLDLYAGTGAVGIEALSRGAGHVVFVEQAPAALRALRSNLARLRITRGAVVLERAVAPALRALLSDAGRGAPFDVVFLDPPYESAGEYSATLSLLGGVAAEVLLAPGIRVVAEHASRSALPERAGQLARYRTLRQGDAALSFFALADRA